MRERFQGERLLFSQIALSRLQDILTCAGTDRKTLQQVMAIANRHKDEIGTIEQGVWEEAWRIIRLAGRPPDLNAGEAEIFARTARLKYGESIPRLRGLLGEDKDRYSPEDWQKIQKALDHVFSGKE